MNSTNDIKIQDSRYAGSSTATNTSKSSSGEGAVALSLLQLEELLNGLEAENGSPVAAAARQKKEESKEELLQEIVEELKTGLAKGLKTNPEGVRNMVSLTANTLSQLTKTDPKATAAVVTEVTLAIHDFLEEHPGDLDKVVYAFSPLIATCGEGVLANLAKASTATQKFAAACANEDPATAQEQLQHLVEKLFDPKSAQTLATLLNSVKEELNSLDASDKTKYKTLVQSLYNILSMIAVTSPDTAQEKANALLKNGFISSVYSLNQGDMGALLQALEKVVKEKSNPNSQVIGLAIEELQNILGDVTSHKRHHSHGAAPTPEGGGGGDIVGNINGFLNSCQDTEEKQNTANLSTILGLAMLYFQQFQQSVAQSQAEQDQATIAIGQVSVNSSMQLQTQLDAQIQKEVEEAAKANRPHPWWDFLIEAIVALVAVIVSAVTAGVGAAIAAGMVAAFMASPLGAKVQTAIAEKIAGGSEQDLYNKYVSEGMSPQAAQAKASEEWNKAMGFAGLIIIVATIIVTAGVGGIGGAAEGAGNAAEEAAEDAASEAADNGSSFTYSASQGLKVGLTQGLSMLASLDPMLNFLMSDPKIANDKKLVEGLSVTLEIVTMALAVGAGCWTASSSASTLADTFSGLVKPLIYANVVIGAGSSGYNIYTNSMQASYLAETAELLGQIGVAEQSFTLTEGQIKMNQQTQTNINTADTSLMNQISSVMNTVENMAGQPAAAANQVLAG